MRGQRSAWRRRGSFGALASVCLFVFTGCHLQGGPRFKGPFELQSTLDLELQDLAERTVLQPIRAARERGTLPGDVTLGFVLLDNASGDVLVYVQSLEPSRLDYAAGLHTRDIGSLAKPFVFLAALASGAVSPSDEFLDAPLARAGGWVPDNHDHHYLRRMLALPEALGESSNVVSFQVYRRTPEHAFLRTVQALGLPSSFDREQASVGRWTASPLELASAYSVFAGDGTLVAPRMISGVIDSQGAVVRRIEANRRAAFDERWCRVVADGMKLCLTEGTGRAARDLGDVCRGKTGTSTLDAWAVLQSRRVTACLWVGRGSPQDLDLTGGEIAMPRLAAFFRELRRMRPDLVPSW
jgi:penicillin-binding protein 1A